jgi:hypothetical protein
MDSYQLIRISAYVLADILAGNSPSAENVEALRAAMPEHSGLPIDELAHAVAHREIDKLHQPTDKANKDTP